MADTLLFTDTFTGTNGASWSGTNWGVNGSTGTAASIQSNQGRLSVPTTANANIKAWGLTVDVLHGDITAKVTKGTNSTTTKIYVGPAHTFDAGGTGDFAHSNGIWVEFTNTANAVMTLKAAKAGVVTTGSTFTPTWALGGQMNVRVRREGNFVYLRVWAIGASEPSTWDVTWNAGTALPTDSTNMRAFLALHNPNSTVSSNNMSFDDVSAYSVPAPVAINYSATPQTASADIVAPTISTVTVVSAVVTPATATATLVPPAGAPVNVSILQDATGFPGDTTTVRNGTTVTLGNTSFPTFFGAFKADLASIPSDFTKATLWFTPTSTTSAGSTNFTVKRLTTNWTETSAVSDASTGTAVDTTTASPTASTPMGIDVTNALTEYVANGGHGLYVHADTSLAVYSKETANAPYLVVEAPHFVTNPVPVSVNPTAPALTASAAAVMPAVTVTTHIDANPTATALSASADIVNPAVSAVISIPAGYTATAMAADATSVTPAVEATVLPNVSLTADAATATATFTAGVFSSNANETPAPATASATSVNAGVSTEHNVHVSAITAFALAGIIPPAEAQGNEADPYYLRVASQTRIFDQWYRLDEVSGTTAKNEAHVLFSEDNTVNATWVGTPTFGGVGPEARRTVHLSGDDYLRFADNDAIADTGTMEFTIRTTKANQVLVTGIDSLFGVPLTAVNTTISEVALNDGRVEVQLGIINAAGVPAAKFVGGKAINDNEWHHVAVTWAGNRINVMVDGALAWQRRISGNAVAVPDNFGGGPASRAIGPDYDQAAFYDPARKFEGDVMEFVFHANHALTPDEVTGNYYAVFGIIPLQPGVASASAAMGNAKGKGNKKRALALFYSTDVDTNMQTSNHWDTYNWTGIRTAGTRTLSQFGSKPFEMDQFLVFPKSIIRDEYAPVNSYLEGAYFDEVTGEPRYIDISTEVEDVEDYDLIFFLNTPPLHENSREGLSFAEQQTLAANYEAMMDGVRRVIDRGVSFWAPQPEVAIALGVINNLDVHTMGRETSNVSIGNASGIYDYRGALIDPWKFGARQNALSNDPLGLVNPNAVAESAKFYYDTHALNKYRVVATVPGLTDLGGWRIKDYVYGFYQDIFKPPFEAWQYEEIPGGLQIGMTEYYHQDYYALGSNNFYPSQRDSVLSVPPSAVLTGTVVLKEVATHYVGGNEVDNPWRENAVAIVVNPGDSLKGRPVGGKIFVSFMSQAEEALTILPVQEFPENSSTESTESKKWQYSSGRISTTGQVIGSGNVFVYVPPSDANVQTGSDPAALLQAYNQYKSGSDTLVSTTETQIYPLHYVKRFTLIERAMHWLGIREVVSADDALNRVAASTATATAPMPTVVAEKDAEITTTAAVAYAQVVAPEGFRGPSTEIHVFSADAYAYMTGYGKTVAVPPATAYAEAVENFNLVHATGERVVLTLHYEDATLFLKEDA